MKEKIGILGFGEIGQAIAKFYTVYQVEDIKYGKKVFTNLDILHICIPYSSNFTKIVKNRMRKTNAKLTIIHSTVPVGTTKKIGGIVVHNPVRGIHPNLYKGIKTFDNFVGYDLFRAGLEVKRHYKKLGLTVHLVSGSRNTEALKLWDTTQYGLMIVLNKEIKKYCNKHNLNFDVVYSLANKSYNEGYLKLGRPDVVRPFLKYMPGPIGGHYVLSNCKLLDDPIAKLILSLKY